MYLFLEHEDAYLIGSKVKRSMRGPEIR